MKRRDDDRQLDLFGPATPQKTIAPATPRAPDDALVSLAAALPARLHFGTSSWTFPGWAGLVYHATYASNAAFLRDSLAEYARHPIFGTVGIDRSYYAPIPREELAGYSAQLPEGFRGVAKVWNELTTLTFPDHPKLGPRRGAPNPAFLDVARFEAEVLAPHRDAFAAHTGPFVFEIPRTPGAPDVARFEASLQRFLEQVPRDFPLAFEVRDTRMMSRRYSELLHAHGVSHVFNAWSHMPGLQDQLARVRGFSAPHVVVRLLLPRGQRYEQLKRDFAPFDRIVVPQPEMLSETVSLVLEALRRDAEIFVLVNNKAEGSAPLSVRTLAQQVVAALRPRG